MTTYKTTYEQLVNGDGDANKKNKANIPVGVVRQVEGAPGAQSWTNNPSPGTPELITMNKPAQQQTAQPTVGTNPTAASVPQQTSEKERQEVMDRNDDRLKRYAARVHNGETISDSEVQKDEKPKEKEPLEGYDKAIAILETEVAKRAAEEETPEMKAKRERRERNQRTLASISDAVRAASNLYFTSQYAPNMYSSQNTLTGKAQERFDKAKALRDKNHDEYLNLSLKLSDAEGKKKDREKEAAAAAAERERQARLDQEKRDQAAKEFKLKQDDLQRKKDKDAADGAREDAKLKETIRANRAAERISASKGRGGRSGGGSGADSDYTIRLNDNSVHHYDKSLTGALSSLAPTMEAKARAAAKRYRATAAQYAANNDTTTAAQYYDKADHYEEIADKIKDKANTRDVKAAIVAANVWDFESMDADVRKILGIGAATSSSGTKKKVQGVSPSTTAKSKKAISGYGGKKK